MLDDYSTNKLRHHLEKAKAFVDPAKLSPLHYREIMYHLDRVSMILSLDADEPDDTTRLEWPKGE